MCHFSYISIINDTSLCCTGRSLRSYDSAKIEKLLDGSWSVFWIKMVSCWVCLVLYMWTLVAPMVCPKRFEAWGLLPAALSCSAEIFLFFSFFLFIHFEFNPVCVFCYFISFFFQYFFYLLRILDKLLLPDRLITSVVFFKGELLHFSVVWRPFCRLLSRLDSQAERAVGTGSVRTLLRFTDPLPVSSHPVTSHPVCRRSILCNRKCCVSFFRSQLLVPYLCSMDFFFPFLWTH